MRRLLISLLCLMAGVAAFGQKNVPGFDPSLGGGLQLNIASGVSICGTTPTPFNGGSVVLNDNAVNYVYLDTAQSCIPSVNTSGFSGTTLPIAKVTTSGGVIVALQDLRARLGSSGNLAAYLPLTGGAMTGPIQGWTGGTAFSVGTVSGNPSHFYLQKNDSKYGFEVYDNNPASTTCCTEDFNGEVYNRNANLSGLVTPYRAHIDPSNTQTTDHQLAAYAAGVHGDHADGYVSLCDGLHSTCTFAQAMGTQNNLWYEGIPFGGAGVSAITYVSGGTFSGTGACLLIPSNNAIVNASAEIAVSAGTPGAVTVRVYGQAATSAPTQATVSNLQPGPSSGTASCSGTITITSTLITSVPTIGTIIQHTSTGNIFQIFQGANPMSADAFYMNANFGASGAFTGSWFNFLNNSATVYSVLPNGITESALGTVATATTIAPTTAVVNLTGTTAIATITLPASATTAFSSTIGGCLTFVPASTVATTTAGNIFAVYSLLAGKAYHGCWNGTKWYFIGSGI